MFGQRGLHFRRALATGKHGQNGAAASDLRAGRWDVGERRIGGPRQAAARKCATASWPISRSRRAKRIRLPQVIPVLACPAGAAPIGTAGSDWPAHADACQASSDWRLARSRISTDAV